VGIPVTTTRSSPMDVLLIAPSGATWNRARAFLTHGET
jgi:hypothetical protein